MSLLFSYLSAIAAFLVAGVGVYVLTKGPKREPNQAFTLWTLWVTATAFADLTRRTAPDARAAYTWATTEVVGLVVVAALFVHFVSTLPGGRRRIPWLQYAGYGVGTALIPGIMMGLVVADVEPAPVTFEIRWGLLTPILVLWIAVLFGLGAYSMVQRVSDVPRGRYYLVGFAAIGLTALIDFLALKPTFGSLGLPTTELASLAASLLFAVLVSQYRYVVVASVVEGPSLAKPKFRVTPGAVYLIKEDRFDLSWRFFRDLVQQGYAGLIVARNSPGDGVLGDISIKLPIIQLANGRGEFQIAPTDVAKLSFALQSFLQANPRPVVLLQGLEYLATNNDFLRALKLVQTLHDLVRSTEGIAVLSLQPRAWEERELTLLESETERPPAPLPLPRMPD